MKDLFTSQDSKFAIKTAFLVSLVPVLMLVIVIYSTWLLLSINFSYFLANGFPLSEENQDVFIDYLLQSQAEYLPHTLLFFIGVFFLGLFLSFVILRPFSELSEMCRELVLAKDERIRIVGLEKSKLLIKLGNFICRYFEAQKNGREVSVPQELLIVKKPVMDYVFYFQFFCLILILMTIAIGSLYLFVDQLHDSIIYTAMQILKAPKGMSTFLATQKNVFDMIVFIPSLIGAVLYVFLARVIISRVQGVTYGYVRDVCEIASGNKTRRLSNRDQDPGRQAAIAVNEVMDILHPGTKVRVEVVQTQSASVEPSKA
jgi:methyl-accepting chemotaxis protein